MKISTKEGLKLQLNPEDHTATVIESPKATGNVFIPRQVQHEKETYFITILGKRSFASNEIESITFPDDSEVTIFKKDCFNFTYLKKLQIPPKLNTLEEDWNSYTKGLIDIEISVKNDQFIYLDQKFLLGKSDPKSDVFNILHYARFDIEEAIIPPQVEIVKKNSFICHAKLKTMIFPDNSNARIIEDHAFYKAPIERLKLSSKLEEINPGNFRFLSNLVKVEVTPENPIFYLFEDKILLKKSEKASPTFDKLFFCCRDAENIKIPSYIKEISEHAFEYCKQMKTLVFDPNSSLEVINSNAFSMCESPKNFVFPPSVKIIHDQAFYAVKSLETIQFLSTIIEFKCSCFSGCRNLKSISFPNVTELTLESNSFNNIPSETEILVGHGVKLSGKGADKYQKQIKFIEQESPEPKHTSVSRFKPAIKVIDGPNKEKKNAEKEELKKKSAESQQISKYIQHIRFLENRLKKYEEVFPFDPTSDEPQENYDYETISDEYKDENKPRTTIFIDKEEESHQRVVEQIGEGATSITYKVIDERSNMELCKKVLKAEEEKTTFKDFQNMYKEFEVLQGLFHPSICQCIGINPTEELTNTSNDDENNNNNNNDDDDDYYDIQVKVKKSDSSSSSQKAKLKQPSLFSSSIIQ